MNEENVRARIISFSMHGKDQCAIAEACGDGGGAPGKREPFGSTTALGKLVWPSGATRGRTAMEEGKSVRGGAHGESASLTAPRRLWIDCVAGRRRRRAATP